MAIYKLSPSDLTFQWDECKYCFYMKVKHNLVLRTPFPSIFGKMANLTSEFYQGRTTAEISPSLPPGVVQYREKFVKSEPIAFPGMETEVYISGRFDAVIAFEDGSYGIVDYKTSEAKDEHVAFYQRQLAAYVYALEHPAPKALALAPVSKLGLFVITPERYERNPEGEMVYVSRRTWMEVPLELETFLGFLRQVLQVLDSPTPPEPAEGCGVCGYRKSMREFGESAGK